MPAQFPPQPPKLTAEMIARAVARLAIEAQAAKASPPLNRAPRPLSGNGALFYPPSPAPLARPVREGHGAPLTRPIGQSRLFSKKPGIFPRPTKVDMVWNKGRIDPSVDVTGRIFRRDRYGFPIARSEYGNRNSNHGWEIDHIKPVAAGGTDELHNLQPLYWDANCIKSDKF